MKFVVLDFETMSACDLKKAGAWRYSEDPTTSIICLGYQIDEEPIGVVPADKLRFDRGTDLGRAASNPAVIFIAHNVGFEKAIWRNIMVPQYGWPDIENSRWHDTMASCAMKALPLSLDRAVSALRLHVQKDTGGTKATLALGRVNKKGYIDHTPEKLQRVYDYCAQDVRTELGLHRRVRGLGAAERKVWLLDQTINERGVKLDMEFVAAAQEICDQASKPLLAEFREIVGVNPTQDEKFKAWLKDNGVMIPDLQKETVARILGEQDGQEIEAFEEVSGGNAAGRLEMPTVCDRALRIRSVLGSASIKKLQAMRACVASDGRAHGLLQYHGAGPGRWAGRLLQPQNFPRPTLKQVVGWKEDGTEILEGHDPEGLVAAIMSKDAEFVRLCYGEPIEAVANGLRHAIISGRGRLLEVGDYAKIECVIVLALAGQADTARNVIERGSAVYTDMATKIFKRQISKNDLKEYTIGKNTILGCGFQMGAAKFEARYCPGQPDFAKEAIDEYRQRFAPRVPKLWYALEDAAVRTVWDKTPHEAYGIEYNLEDGFLTARLPSGRKLWYYDPRPARKHMLWSTPEKPDVRACFEYSAQKKGQWKRIPAYGGLLTENVVQGTARDIMVAGMFNAEAAGHPVVLTVHDEIVCEVKEEIAGAETLDAAMTDMPQWAKSMGIPVSAECWTGARYRK